MKRYLIGITILAFYVSVARAHFIFIVPDAKGETSAKVILSEDLKPDAAVPIGKLGSTKLFVRGGNEDGSEIKLTKGSHAYNIEIPNNGPAVIGGKCVYGVLRRGQAKPFLVTYHPKYVRGPLAASEPWDKLAFEIVPLGGDQFRVLFNGRPAAGAEVNVVGPRTEGQIKTDDKGEFHIDTSKPGVYGLRAKHIEPKAGEIGGKKYSEVQHYATLTFRIQEPHAGG